MPRFVIVCVSLLGLLVHVAKAGDDGDLKVQLREPIPAIASLRAIAELESNRKWLACAQKAHAAIKTQLEIQDWIFAKGLRCARLSKNKSEIDLYLGQAPITLMSMQFPTARPTILKELSRLIASTPGETLTDYQRLAKPAELILLWGDKTDKDTRARAFEILGQFFLVKKEMEAARQQFTLSLREKETRRSRDRFNQISLLLRATPANLP